MANFWDCTDGPVGKGALVGRVGAAFTSTASQHGGQETTLISILTNLLHRERVITGLPYSFQELDGACFLGAHVAGINAKLAA